MRPAPALAEAAAALERENRDLRLQLGAIAHAARCRDWRTVAEECAGLEVDFDGPDPVVPSRRRRSAGV